MIVQKLKKPAAKKKLLIEFRFKVRDKPWTEWKQRGVYKTDRDRENALIGFNKNKEWKKENGEVYFRYEFRKTDK